MFMTAINAAKERLWIASPYFVPEHSVIVALQLAGLRGVDVRIMVDSLGSSSLKKKYLKALESCALNAGFMRKRVFSDDRLVALHKHPCDACHQPARRHRDPRHPA